MRDRQGLKCEPLRLMSNLIHVNIVLYTLRELPAHFFMPSCSFISVPRAADALISYMLALPGNEDVLSINPVVGETNDGYLSDIRGRHVSPHDVFAALKNAKGGLVEALPIEKTVEILREHRVIK